MTGPQILRGLLAHWGVIVGTLVLALTVAILASLFLPKQYSASASVIIDVRSPDPIAGMVLPVSSSYMATQMDIITSERVVRQVIHALKLTSNPTIRRAWREATNGIGHIEDWLTALLSRYLEVRPSRDSNVIYITYTSPDAEFSKTMANAFAQAYMAVNVDLRVGPAREYANWFDSQTDAQRRRLEAAKKALSTYQQETGILLTDDRIDYETGKLNDLSSQLTLAQVQAADARSKSRSGSAETLPEVIQNPLINGLKADLARKEAALQELAGNLGARHPQYQRQLAEVRELRSRLNTEIRHVAQSVAANNAVAMHNEAQIAAAIEAQKNKLLNLKSERDRIEVLQRDVALAQQAFDAVGQRFAAAQLESEAMQTNVVMLTPATTPLSPSWPRPILNVAVAIVLSLLFGCALALLLEFRNRRIRSVTDLQVIPDLPVLTVIDARSSRLVRKRKRFQPFHRLRLGADSGA